MLWDAFSLFLMVGPHYDQMATVANLATVKTVTKSRYSLSVHSKHALEVAKNFHYVQRSADLKFAQW